eukprot:GEMP01009595.1.p1 GENE.GEMP01009595.1~~GEMP01009595.1.p1  ORF type:complete len:515 (+),score=118.33 GEMP01009595.1:124-1668(+)
MAEKVDAERDESYGTFADSAIPTKESDGMRTAILRDVMALTSVGPLHYRILIFTFFNYLATSTLFEILPLVSPLMQKDLKLKAHMVALLSTMMFMGAICGTLVGGYISDMCGRKTTLKLATLIVLIFAVLQVGANLTEFWVLCTLRVFLGFSFGATLNSMRPYLVEFLPTSRRGFYLSIVSAGWTTGTLYCILIAAVIAPGDWRGCFFYSFFPFTIVAVMLFWPNFLPESPRWLYVNNRPGEGKQVVKQLCQGQLPPQTHIVVGPSFHISSPQAPRRSHEWILAWIDRVKITMTPQFARTTLAFNSGFLLLGAASYGTSFWRPTMLANVGSSRELPFVALAIVETTSFFGIVCIAVLMDFFSRKMLAICAFVLTALGNIIGIWYVQSLMSLTTLFCVTNITTNLAWESLGNACVETYPTVCRGTAFGVALTHVRVGAALAPFLLGLLITFGNAAVFSALAGLFFLGAIAVTQLRIATVNQSMEDSTDAVLRVSSPKGESQSLEAYLTDTSPVSM